MILITSPAGVRMAKAYAAMNAAHEECDDGEERDRSRIFAARQRYYAAAEEVAKELMEQNLHEMTGP